MPIPIYYNPYTIPTTGNSGSFTINPPSMHQSTIPGGQLLKVNGIESAKAFNTLPNSQIALFDANEDVMYIKTTDANGFATIRKFRFVEESEEPLDASKYVTIEEFNKFKEEILNGKQSVL